jgi:hypothetical protein
LKVGIYLPGIWRVTWQRGGRANITLIRSRKYPVNFSRCPYKDRNVTERCCNKPRPFRYYFPLVKPAANFWAMLKLTCIRL